MTVLTDRLASERGFRASSRTPHGECPGGVLDRRDRPPLCFPPALNGGATWPGHGYCVVDVAAHAAWAGGLTCSARDATTRTARAGASARSAAPRWPPPARHAPSRTSRATSSAEAAARDSAHRPRPRRRASRLTPTPP